MQVTITKFDTKRLAALTKIALYGEARRIDVLSGASDEIIKAILAGSALPPIHADTTVSNLGSMDGIAQVSVQHQFRRSRLMSKYPKLRNDMNSACFMLPEAGG